MLVPEGDAALLLAPAFPEFPGPGFSEPDFVVFSECEIPDPPPLSASERLIRFSIRLV